MNFMTWGYETPFTVLLTLIAVFIVAIAQSKISSAYKKYRREKNIGKKSGASVARELLDANGLESVYVIETRGELTDHYDPNRKVIRLSRDIFHGESIAAMGVAAHEVGHAIQDKEGYPLLRFRSALVPFVNVVSYLGYFGIVLSIFAGITGYFLISILVLIATLVFQLVTLPIEFDASKRALKELRRLNLCDGSEQGSVEEMLKAAAMTYVASLASNVLNLLRVVLMYHNSKDD